MTPDEIHKFMKALQTQNPRLILDKMREGDIVFKGTDLAIVIDDVALVKHRCGTAGGLSMSTIRDAFPNKPDKNGIAAYYESVGKKDGSTWLVLLSKFIQDGVGTCTEMAVVTQLLAQHIEREAYMIIGSHSEGGSLVAHAWNVMRKGDVYFVFDAALNTLKEIDGIDVEGKNYWFIKLKGEQEPTYFF